MLSPLKKWPEYPYKGLTYYDAGDRPIFTGREDEVHEVSKLLDEGQTRILLLHGDTGCGKSSFLRAGLIPHLEDLRFKFFHEKPLNNSQSEPVFITASEAPLLKLSKAIFNHAAAEERDKLPERLRDMEEKEFACEVGNNPGRMLQVLKDIASRSPKTLVLIIDQAEEVMTLWPENSENEHQKNFFEFLYVFSSKQINVKLILSLRTEYYGKFISGIHPYTFNMAGFRDYYLKPLADEELKNAIELPTRDQPVNDYGKPRDKYKFSYEEELVQKIANDLNSSSIIGSRLAVMQVICKRLYEATRRKAINKNRHEWTIKCSDYAALGKIPDQLNAYVDETLSDKINESKLEDDVRRLEINRWKNILHKLIDAHADGRVTKRYETEEELINAARLLKCKLDPKDTLDFLSDSTRQVLRQEVQTVPSQVDDTSEKIDPRDRKVIQYTLAHDAIGLALKEWKSVYDTIAAGRKHRIIYSAAERDDLILHAARYSQDELYGPGSNPPRKVLGSVNDYLWDHQILTFASHKKFFKRLGIELSFANIFVDKKEGHNEVESLLTSKVPASILVSYPRSLIDKDAKQTSLDFAVSNIFTGYAVIGRQSFNKQFQLSKPVETYIRTWDELSRLRIAAEDEGAKNFIKTLEDLTTLTKLIARDPTPATGTGAADSAMLLNGRYELFKKLETGEIDVFVGTAPSRAYATQAGYPIYLDSNDALHVLQNVARTDVANAFGPELKKLGNQLILHNCWNLNVAEHGWENNQELTDLILRLTSVAFFTSRYIRRAQEEVTEYLQTLNNWVKNLDRDVMRDTFEICYDFSLNESYFDAYLDKCSRYYYNASSSNGLQSEVNSNPHKVYKLMLGLRQKYYELSENFDTLMPWQAVTAAQSEAQLLKERARRHYHIFNYVDAVSILERACDMLSHS